jgi:hypothetical protein
LLSFRVLSFRFFGGKSTIFRFQTNLKPKTPKLRPAYSAAVDLFVLATTLVVLALAAVVFGHLLGSQLLGSHLLRSQLAGGQIPGSQDFRLDLTTPPLTKVATPLATCALLVDTLDVAAVLAVDLSMEHFFSETLAAAVLAFWQQD